MSRENIKISTYRKKITDAIETFCKTTEGIAISRGSVKELWSVGDYEINIEGILVGSNGEYPTEAVQRLVNICESREPVIISNDNLNNPLDIQRIVIESYDFPFTKGLNNQVFSIRATSDVQYSLLIK